MAALNTELKYKVLGFNDDECECHICGRVELKGTYAIEDLSTGTIFRAGSSCGAKMAKWTTKELSLKLKLAEKENLQNAQSELKSSQEYINYNTALDKLNKDADLLYSKIYKETSQEKRNELSLLELRPSERLAILRPFSEKLNEFKDQLKVKYNLKSFY